MGREKSSHEPAVGLPRNLPPVIPEATSPNLGWVGLQAVRYRDSAMNEIHVPPLSQHLLVLITKPPAEMNLRYEGVKRETPPPVGSVMVMPVGSVTEWGWRGTKDSFHSQFLITRRVECAQQLLRGARGVSLAEVAIGVGFSDQSQFSFHFKRIVGVTPGQFRASAKIP